MKKRIYGMALVLFCSAVLFGRPQDQAQPSPFGKLRSDLATAVKNANLTGDQKKTLQDAGDRLRAAGEARQSGGKIDRGSVKKAFSEIRKVAESGAFQPEDSAAVKADLDALRESRGGSRRRLFRRQ